MSRVSLLMRFCQQKILKTILEKVTYKGYHVLEYLIVMSIAVITKIQIGRQKVLNSRLGAADMDKYCLPDTEAQNSARSTLGGLGLSAGSYHRILKIARTIADLAHE